MADAIHTATAILGNRDALMAKMNRTDHLLNADG
jgi:hypothetical protein